MRTRSFRFVLFDEIIIFRLCVALFGWCVASPKKEIFSARTAGQTGLTGGSIGISKSQSSALTEVRCTLRKPQVTGVLVTSLDRPPPIKYDLRLIFGLATRRRLRQCLSVTKILPRVFKFPASPWFYRKKL
jgi:hypothetical protein